MFRCGWCGTDDHDKCKPYVIGPIGQIWWCKCECDKTRQKRYAEDAERDSKQRKDDIAWFEPPKTRKRRKRKVG